MLMIMVTFIGMVIVMVIIIVIVKGVGMDG